MSVYKLRITIFPTRLLQLHSSPILDRGLSSGRQAQAGLSWLGRRSSRCTLSVLVLAKVKPAICLGGIGRLISLIRGLALICRSGAARGHWIRYRLLRRRIALASIIVSRSRCRATVHGLMAGSHDICLTSRNSDDGDGLGGGEGSAGLVPFGDEAFGAATHEDDDDKPADVGETVEDENDDDANREDSGGGCAAAGVRAPS